MGHGMGKWPNSLSFGTLNRVATCGGGHPKSFATVMGHSPKINWNALEPCRQWWETLRKTPLVCGDVTPNNFERSACVVWEMVLDSMHDLCTSTPWAWPTPMATRSLILIKWVESNSTIFFRKFDVLLEDPWIRMFRIYIYRLVIIVLWTHHNSLSHFICWWTSLQTS